VASLKQQISLIFNRKGNNTFAAIVIMAICF